MLGRVLIVLAVVGASSVLVACGFDSPDAAAPRTVATGSGDPPQRLRAEANQLLDGRPEAFEARLAELRGHPVVVNQSARPTTALYDALGQLAFTHIRAYATQAKLEEELREHALNG